MWASIKFTLLLLILWNITGSYAEFNIHEKMYYDLDPDSFASCVRRFNGTHQFGCSSDIDGNVGVLHTVTSQKDVDWLIHNSTRGPYVALILDLSMFSRSYLVPLNSSSNINGIIFRNTQLNKPETFSQEDSCPNRYTSFIPNTRQPSCDSASPWNPYGTNIMNENWNFPIVIISNDTIIDSLVECYNKHNIPLSPSSVQDDSWHPLCAVEMQMGMSGNTNTEVCIRRSRLYYENHAIKQCDALGSRNIVYSADKLSADKPLKNNSLIVVTARLDSKSMFDGIVPGAVSTVTSIVALLATARVLSQARTKLPPQATPTSNILFLLLDGEAYDFIGSSRVIYDMKEKAFPKESLSVGPEHIKLMVELSQLTADKYLGIHFNTPANYDVQDFTRQIKLNANGTKVEVDSYQDSNPLTPSSLLYFQNAFANLSGLLLTSSNESVNTNKFYHSIFDDESNVNYRYYNKAPIPEDSIQSTIKEVATILGRSLLNQMYGDGVTSTETVDEHLIDEMLYCYLKSHNCSLFTQLTGYMDNTRPTYYVGIKDYKRYIVTATGILLANLTGTVTNLTKEECKTRMNNIYDPGTSDNDNYYWIVTNMSVESAGYCNKNLVNFTAAVSPAFTVEGYNWSSSQYPSWSESVWTRLGLRTFIQPSPSYERLVFLCGLGVLALSFVCVLTLKKHIKQLVNSVVTESVLHTAGVAGTS